MNDDTNEKDKCPDCGNPGGRCAHYGLYEACLRRQLAAKDTEIKRLRTALYTAGDMASNLCICSAGPSIEYFIDDILDETND